MTQLTNLKSQFLLDPDVIFLNHGSFGATPKPVFDVYQEWQRRLERQPVLFLGREIGDLLAEARHALGDYLHTPADDLVYIPNATYGVNVVARSLDLQPGDEVLTTDHEYGACLNAWEFACQQTDAILRQQHISLPVQSFDDIVEQFWQGVTPRTKVIFLSHITSATAVTFPISAICAKAHEAGILTVVDGAHAPGQIPLDLPAIGADFYTGNCHKWLMSAKGAAFLYARPEVQHLIKPLVVSWGSPPNKSQDYGSYFLDALQWTGTNDPAAYLSVPAAIEFQQANNWTDVQQSCHELACGFAMQLSERTGLAPLYPIHREFFTQLILADLPPVDGQWLKQHLYDDYRIEVPITDWNGRCFVRVSVQAYNDQHDLDILYQALTTLLRLDNT